MLSAFAPNSSGLLRNSPNLKNHLKRKVLITERVTRNANPVAVLDKSVQRKTGCLETQEMRRAWLETTPSLRVIVRAATGLQASSQEAKIGG